MVAAAAMPTELQAARLRLIKGHPYLAAAAYALQPRETPGLATLGVDEFWRLYYDPAVVSVWSVEELAGVLYHEICHLLRDHPERMKNLDPRLANIATDAEINDNLMAERVKLPAGAVTPSSLGQPDGLLAEEYYAALSSQTQRSGSQPGASSGAEGADGCGTTRSTPEGGGETPPQKQAQESQPGDDGQPGDREDASGSKAGDPDGTESGTDGGGAVGNDKSPNPSASDSPSGAPAQSEAASQPPTPRGKDVGGGNEGGEPGAETQTAAPGAGRCGSCATGHHEPWEEGPPQNGDGVGRAEGELIRREVARKIKEASQGRGAVPGHWARWAEEKLEPRVNWRRELAAAVRHAVADVSGASDYSYRRPGRRQGQVGNGNIVLPSLRTPVPEVAVVVDTSGSMSDGLLGQALAEVAGVLKATGMRQGISVLAVDTEAHVARRVFDARQVHLAGGGGTDMGAGLAAAVNLRPRPQVVVILTDGYTPWPETAPRGVKVIVGLLGGGTAPQWAKAVEIK